MQVRPLPDPAPATDANSVPGGPREDADDFYCLRYRIWYASLDCAYRTKFRTSPGCLACEQGRFNFKRHAQNLARVRPIALAVV